MQNRGRGLPEITGQVRERCTRDLAAAAYSKPFGGGLAPHPYSVTAAADLRTRRQGLAACSDELLDNCVQLG